MYIENEALELAQQNMEKLLKEYKEASANDKINALHRYMEASAAYRTLLKHRYNL